MFPCTDAFVIKLDPAGNVLFATYFGGNGSQTVASAICVDASGNVYWWHHGPNTVSQPDTFPLRLAPRSPTCGWLRIRR